MVCIHNWEGVSEFVSVAETESFTAASRRLGISTAQVSRQVNALENRLATKLFYRTTRKVSVTEAGQVYYQHCRQVLDGLDQAERALTDLHTSPRGKLKITAPTTYGENKIAPLLNEFILLYPELEVQFHLSNQKVDLITEGYDLAIRLGQLEDSTLMAKRLVSRRLYVCASMAYIARYGEPKTLADLIHHNCLKGTLDHWRFQENNEEKAIKISGNFSCNSGQSLLDAALKGIGIVQLPDYYVETYIQQGLLIPLLANVSTSDEGIWAVYPNNRHLSKKVRLLVDFFSERLNP